jgi:iron complex outermembrane receptor protein
MRLSLFLICCLLNNLAFTQGTVTGIVIDAHTQKPLKGAQILAKMAEQSVITNKKGKFNIDVKDGNEIIEITAQGYSSAMITVGTAARIKALLLPINSIQSEVETSYYTENQRINTSSITILKHNEFNVNVSSDIYAYLRGKVPGLSIIQNPTDPLGIPKIMLRGTGAAFSGTYEPLILVNGIVNNSLLNIDPNDVASVTILKDGSAQALYGSQASGGVILIKTK